MLRKSATMVEGLMLEIPPFHVVSDDYHGNFAGQSMVSLLLERNLDFLSNFEAIFWFLGRSHGHILMFFCLLLSFVDIVLYSGQKWSISVTYLKVFGYILNFVIFFFEDDLFMASLFPDACFYASDLLVQEITLLCSVKYHKSL